MEENTSMPMESMDTIEISDDLDLFGDGETSQEPAQEEAPETDTVEEEATQQPETYTIKYNGQEEQYTLEQLTELAQKGRNYDKVKEKADAADKYKKSAEVLEQFAAAAGMSVDDYMAEANTQLSGRQIRELTDQGMSEDLAKELLELRTLKQSTDAKKAESAKQDAVIKQWQAFVDEFPEEAKAFQNDGIPKEVTELINQGKTPTEAFLRYDRSQQNKKAAAEKANAANRKRSPGSAKGLAGSADTDAFLRGFLS